MVIVTLLQADIRFLASDVSSNQRLAFLQCVWEPWRWEWGLHVKEKKRTQRSERSGRIHMFISQGPDPQKTLYTIPIYRSSEQQQCCSHRLALPSLVYLIIRQFLSLAAYCSRVLGLPDEIPKVCVCVCVWLYLTSKGGAGLYSKSLGDNWFAVCSGSSSVK